MSLRSPEKPTQGPADQRVKRDWHNVRKVIDETTPDSEKGKVARAMELTQQVHDAMTDEPSPLMTGKEMPLPSKGKAKSPLGYVKVASGEKGERKKGKGERKDKEGKGGSKDGKAAAKRRGGEKESPEVKAKKRRAQMDPLVHRSMEASEVKRRTGFCSVSDLIAYVLTICNGDLRLV